MSLPIVDVHALVIPKNVAELACHLTVGRQTGSGINDAWIQQHVALDREEGSIIKKPLRLKNAGRVFQLIIEKEIQRRVDNGLVAFFGSFIRQISCASNVVLAGAGASVKH